ncbi:MAG TPA: hypothetical protein VJB06_04445 [archaeon]|nr:hypothetical protein [archaeon]
MKNKRSGKEGLLKCSSILSKETADEIEKNIKEIRKRQDKVHRKRMKRLVKQMKGCVKESKIDPLKLKKIWKA